MNFDLLHLDKCQIKLEYHIKKLNNFGKQNKTKENNVTSVVIYININYKSGYDINVTTDLCQSRFYVHKHR